MKSDQGLQSADPTIKSRIYPRWHSGWHEYRQAIGETKWNITFRISVNASEEHHGGEHN